MNEVTKIIINRTGCSRHTAEETTVALSNAGFMKDKKTKIKKEKEQSKKHDVEINEVVSTKGAPY